MRNLGIFLSLAVHCGAIGTAVVVGSCPLALLPPTVPRVELQTSSAEAPAAAAAVDLPPVAAEPDARDDIGPTAPDVEEPFALPRAADLPAAADRDHEPRRPLSITWRQRVVMPAAAAVVETAAPAVDPRERLPEVDVATDVSAFVEASLAADNQPPEYPAAERAAGREGTVVVLAHIDARGDVRDVELASPSPHPGLNREALRAVRGWRFAPARRLGVAVASRFLVPVVFRLTGG